MWYVHVVLPFPDYKRPSVSSHVKIFRTKRDAEGYALKVKQDLLDEWNGDGDTYTLEDLDTPAYHAHKFHTHYMANDPYYIEVGKCVPEGEKYLL